MAQKPVKKAPVKKAAPVKKTTTKKTVKAAPARDMAATMPMHEHHGCGAHCGCGCQNGGTCKCGGGFWRFVKKLFWFLVIFALGFAACMFLCDKPHNGRGPKMPVVFVNGCLDMAQVPCPKMQNALVAADVNGDGCITRDEYRAVKKELRAMRNAGRERGCPCANQQVQVAE
ncbi:MAG: hypothetical protein K2L95_04315 [Alphaproteobacteria bacterium]|nr:hypothetical protein [Alphaproteobacteria bacterium]